MRSVLIFLTTVYISRVQLDESNTVDWNTDDGDKIPTIEIGFEGEVFKIPLREAPFCHLWETHKCLCYMLRKDWNSSDWISATFSYCNGDIGGHFLNSTDYFEIETFGTGSSREFNVTKFPTPENYTEWIIDDVGDEEEMSNITESSAHYFKPLSESGLRNHETGFISCVFVLDKRIFDYEPRDSIDFFLQNLINDANEFLYEFNFLAVYRGWKLAEDTDFSFPSIVDFIAKRHRYYIDKDTHNVVTLFTPVDVYNEAGDSITGKSSMKAICKTSTGIFLKYLQKDVAFRSRGMAATFVHEIGHAMSLEHTEKTPCHEVPEGKIYIMQGMGSDEPGEMVWSQCSKDKIQERREKFFCLRRKIKPPKSSCRNGVLEEGEQCECVSEVCRKCCDDKCQLTEGSECSSGPCCDKETCKPRTKDEKYRCRKAKDSCDIPDMCNGASVKCSPNYVVADGYACGDSSNQAYCFNGMCGKRLDVCRWISSNGRVAVEFCYQQNLRNNSEFGCGPTLTDPKKIANFACKERDLHCGKVFCQDTSHFTEDFRDVRWEKRIVQQSFSDCYYLKLGENTRFLREDPTFVQNGSECGNEKMCVKQKCVSLPTGCPKNCPGELVQHPDTHEWLPAYILPDPDSEEPPVEIDDDPDEFGFLEWFFIIFPISCSVVWIILYLKNRDLSKKQPPQQPNPTELPQQPEYTKNIVIPLKPLQEQELPKGEIIPGENEEQELSEDGVIPEKTKEQE
ncbi:zinc metalloproteinase-disintegrin-like EoMP06 [Brevipalpus obovatus]|uniref:zinc metalloproteinase-disintegrin-like EoMP06 n=1 Tax=Brevipalpus obovatus TaxID=246614 RepID=UPI003D9DB928